MERFDEEQSALVLRNIRMSGLNRDLLSRVLLGEVDALETMKLIETASYQAMDQRDQHIAKTLKIAEVSLRARYKLLQKKEPLKLLVEIGALHIFEQYMGDLPKVVPLTSPQDFTAEERFTIQLYQSGRWKALSNDDLQNIARTRLGLF